MHVPVGIVPVIYVRGRRPVHVPAAKRFRVAPVDTEFIPTARNTTLVIGVLYLLYVTALALAVRWAESRGVSVGFLSRDPNSLAAAPFYAGALSNAGILLWSAAAVSGVLAGCVFWASGSRGSETRMLLGAGFLSGILAVDDLFMIHEQVAPDYLGIPELAVLGAYGGLALAWAWDCRRALLRFMPAVLVIAAVFFAVSLFIDEFASGIPHALYYEDMAKMAGIGGWAVWTCALSFSLLRSGIRG